MPLNESLTSNIVLKDFVDPTTGLVNYEKLKNEQWLQDRVSQWQTMDIGKFTQEEKLAFWLNAYNIFTLKGVLIELSKNPDWKGNLSYWSKVKFFYLRKFSIANKKMNLRYLENEILRKKFNDPRIHFAINCASASCPFLPGRLFDSETLDEFLDSLTSDFINNPSNVRYNEDNNLLKLSMIFKWYSSDFGGKEGLLKFLHKYNSDLPQEGKDLKLDYFNYDWNINSQQGSNTGLTLNI